MKILKYILPLILIASVSRCDFENFPIEQYHNNWGSARTDHYVKQLFEGVMERCQALKDRVSTPDIIETWSVQIGYSNVFTTSGGVGVVNRMPYYLTITTTNQCDNYVMTTNMSWATSWFTPNNSNDFTGQTIIIPPRVVGSFSPAYLQYPPPSSIPIGDYLVYSASPFIPTHNYGQPMGDQGDVYLYGLHLEKYDHFNIMTHTITNPVAIVHLNLSFPITYSFISGLDAKMTAITPYFIDMSQVVSGNLNAWFSKINNATNPVTYPYFTVAGVMSNAHIGITRNVTFDHFGRINGGDAYFTRQPLRTYDYNLWQATRVKCVVNVSGVGDADGDYYAIDNSEDPSPYVGIWVAGYPIYKRVDGAWYITRVSAWYWQMAALQGNDGIWNISPSSAYHNTPPFRNIGDYSLLNQVGTNIVSGHHVYESQLMGVSNVVNSYYWLNSGYQTPYDPPAPISASKTKPSVAGTWKTKALGSFDSRYYDSDPRPKFVCHSTTTGTFSASVSLSGIGYVNFNDPDAGGRQVTETISESLSVSGNNTPSSKRWVSVVSSVISGDAPIGSSVVLKWTSSRFYGNYSYNLEARDLDERALYLKQLLWTTTPYYRWANGVQSTFSGTTSSGATNYSIGPDFHDYGLGDTYYSYDPPPPPDNAAWQALTPPTWGRGIYAGFADAFHPISFWSSYPSIGNGHITANTPTIGAPPYIHATWNSILDRNEASENFTCFTVSPLVDPSTPGHLIIDPSFYDTWPGVGWPQDFTINASDSLNKSQTWDGYSIAANLLVYNNSVYSNQEHGIQTYVRYANNSPYGLGGEIAESSDTNDLIWFDPPTNSFVPQIRDHGTGSIATPAGQTDRENAYCSAWPGTYTPRIYTDEGTEFTNTFHFGSVIVTNALKLRFYHGFVDISGYPSVVYDGFGDFSPDLLTEVFYPAGYVGSSTVMHPAFGKSWVWTQFYYNGGTSNGWVQSSPIPTSASTITYNFNGKYTQSLATDWTTLPKATDPLTVGQDCYRTVYTNYTTITVTYSTNVYYYTNVYNQIAGSSVDYGSARSQGYGSNDNYRYVGQYSNAGSYSVSLSTNLTIINTRAEIVRWDRSNQTNLLVGVRDNRRWLTTQSQNDSGSTNLNMQILPPIMLWDGSSGFKRK